MKVLLVGDGKHDVGKKGADPGCPEGRPMGGVVGTLVRRICPAIDAESPARMWNEIIRLRAGWAPGKLPGWEGKIRAAIVLADRGLGLDGMIGVIDRDGDPERDRVVQGGQMSSMALRTGFPVVCGRAIESIEAWTLGARAALAAELKLSAKALRSLYPADAAIESLRSTSGKSAQHRPKALLQKIAEEAGRTDCTELREAVAEKCDLAELSESCPQGFAPFAAALRTAFGSPEP